MSTSEARDNFRNLRDMENIREEVGVDNIVLQHAIVCAEFSR